MLEVMVKVQGQGQMFEYAFYAMRMPWSENYHDIRNTVQDLCDCVCVFVSNSRNVRNQELRAVVEGF